MSEYYAVQRTGNDLAHYGVKGMRWGVKKAIEANSDKSMSKQFKKASRKLEKLERHGEGKKYAKRAAKLAAGGAALGAAGALGSIKNIDKVASAAARLSSKLSNTPKGKGLHRAVPTVGSKAAGAASNAIRNYEKWGSEKLAGNVTRHGAIRLGSMAAGAGMLGAAGYNAVRAARAKRNRQKAAEFRSEMQKAFKGTQYEGQVANAGYHPKKKAANSGSNTNQHGKRHSSSRNG